MTGSPAAAPTSGTISQPGSPRTRIRPHGPASPMPAPIRADRQQLVRRAVGQVGPVPLAGVDDRQAAARARRRAPARSGRGRPGSARGRSPSCRRSRPGRRSRSASRCRAAAVRAGRGAAVVGPRVRLGVHGALPRVRRIRTCAGAATAADAHRDRSHRCAACSRDSRPSGVRQSSVAIRGGRAARPPPRVCLSMMSAPGSIRLCVRLTSAGPTRTPNRRPHWAGRSAASGSCGTGPWRGAAPATHGEQAGTSFAQANAYLTAMKASGNRGG